MFKGTVKITEEFFLLRFRNPRQALSSAVYNGGWKKIQNVLNLHVPKDAHGDEKDPSTELELLARTLRLKGRTAGLMTAVRMNALYEDIYEENGVLIRAFVTAGVSNARRAGDKADYPFFSEEYRNGTINIILETSLNLSPEAMAELLLIVTEAKTLVLNELNIKSPVSGLIATGTGTDSAVIISGESGPRVRYAGKHVLLGEIAARCVLNSVRGSLRINSPELF